MNTKTVKILLIALGVSFTASFASAYGKNSKKKSNVEKAVAPNVEDYATFFSRNNNAASKEIQKDADRLRLKTIVSIDQLLKSPSLSKIRKFELLLRLGETYVERHDYLRSVEIDKFTVVYDNWEKNGAKGKVPNINHKPSRKELTRAVNSFRKLVIDYPKHPRTDAALFALAQTQSRLGNDNAVMYYKQVLRSHPNSVLIPDIHLALGEHYFDRHKISQAIKSYKKAMKFKQHNAYPYAVYKLGWAYFNAGGRNKKETKKNLQKSVAAFKLVIKLAALPKFHKGSVSLKTEAIKDLIVVWADAEDVDSAWAYFQSIGEKEMFYKLLERLGNIYAEQGKDKKSIKVFTRLLKESPLRESNPVVYAKVAELHDLIGKPEKSVKDLKMMQKLYVGNTAWTIANGNKMDREKLVPAASELVRTNIHRFSATYHDLGQKHKNKIHLRAAADLYQAYLKTFSATKESYEIRFYLAELLHSFKEYHAAAKHYMFVSKQKVKKPKYKRDAALNAVVAMNTFVSKQKYSKLPKRGHVAKVIPLPREKKRLILAIDNFVHLLPDDKETPKMRFTAADIYFAYGYYVRAVNRFASITKDLPKTKESDSSVKLILAYQVDKEAWQSVITWSKKFIAQKNLLSKKLELYVRNSLRNSLFKHGLALEKRNKRKEAAKTFVDFQMEFPKDPSADKALYNASINYYKLGRLDEALAAGNLILDKYPKSNLRVDVMASIGQTYEAVADFKNAADSYQKLATEFPKDRRAEQSLYNSGILYKGLKKLKKSASAFKQVLTQYKQSKIRNDVLMELASVQEDMGDTSAAIDAYTEFAKKYGKKERERGYFASSKAALLMAKGVNRKKGQQNLEKLKNELSKSKIPAYSARRVLASGLFDLYEKDVAEYNAIKINDGHKIESLVGKKNKKLMELAAKYQGIISLGNGEYSVASLYRMGELHEELATSLFKAPAPSGSSQGDIDLFKSQLEKVAFPLREDAYKYFESAFKRSKEVQTFTSWTKKTYDKMVELHPSDHRKIEAENVEPRYLAHKMYITKTTEELIK